MAIDVWHGRKEVCIHSTPALLQKLYAMGELWSCWNALVLRNLSSLPAFGTDSLCWLEMNRSVPQFPRPFWDALWGQIQEEGWDIQVLWWWSPYKPSEKQKEKVLSNLKDGTQFERCLINKAQGHMLICLAHRIPPVLPQTSGKIVPLTVVS